jgi:hypothetical protein
MRIAKRLTEYMAAQPVVFSDDNELVGLMRFDGSVESDLFPRTRPQKNYGGFQLNTITSRKKISVLWNGSIQTRISGN